MPTGKVNPSGSEASEEQPWNTDSATFRFSGKAKPVGNPSSDVQNQNAWSMYLAGANVNPSGSERRERHSENSSVASTTFAGSLKPEGSVSKAVQPANMPCIDVKSEGSLKPEGSDVSDEQEAKARLALVTEGANVKSLGRTRLLQF